MASESGAVQALMHKFLALLRNYREPVTDAEVREYFQSEDQGEYEKLPSVLNVLMSEVCCAISAVVNEAVWRMS